MAQKYITYSEEEMQRQVVVCSPEITVFKVVAMENNNRDVSWKILSFMRFQDGKYLSEFRIPPLRKSRGSDYDKFRIDHGEYSSCQRENNGV